MKGIGFFFEAGAGDGEFISNTLRYEMNLGWSGLLVEANPDLFSRLLQKNRKSWSINACISRKPYPEIVEFVPNGYLGGIVEDYQKHITIDGSQDKFFKVQTIFVVP